MGTIRRLGIVRRRVLLQCISTALCAIAATTFPSGEPAQAGSKKPAPGVANDSCELLHGMCS
eukprot:7074425-Lingulodinium_polyedra.AAC.1